MKSQVLVPCLEEPISGVEPSQQGKPATAFVGLEKAPIITSEMEGKRFSLQAPRLGSLNPGSPIYFRQVKVGQVAEFQLNKDGDNVGITIFIDSPYDQFVRENSRFWLSSGLDLQLTANGLRVDTQSMVSLMIGGVAFSSVTDEPSPAPQQTRYSDSMKIGTRPKRTGPNRSAITILNSPTRCAAYQSAPR